MSDRYKTKAERDAFLEAWDIDLHDDDLAGRDLNDYYEEGKPITFEGWKKLIEDLNELFEAAPGECEAIGALSLPESPQVWTIEDVEEVREKMIEMCENTTFDWGWYQPGFQGPDNDLLRFPFGREIIYEIVDQMRWCNCGSDIYSLGEVYPELGGCLPAGARTGEDLEGLIGGMGVGTADFKGTWQVNLTRHSTAGDAETEALRAHYAARYPERDVPWWVGRSRNSVRLRSGELDCAGGVDYGDEDPYTIPDSWLINYECYLDDECILATEPPVFWFGPGWEEYNQEVFDQCVEDLAQRRSDAIDEAQQSVDNLTDQGRWDEWVLVVNTGTRVHPDCED